MTIEQYCECAKGEAMWCPVHGRGDDPRVAHRLRELLGTAVRDYEVMNKFRQAAEKERDELRADRDRWCRIAEDWEEEKQTYRIWYEDAVRERDELRADRARLCAELFATSMAGVSPDDVENLKEATATIHRKPDGQLEYVRDDDWIIHDSHEPPADLAAAQLVWFEQPDYPGACGEATFIHKVQVGAINWKPGLRYRPALSANGLPLCSPEGLREDARYVTTNIHGRIMQHPHKPLLNDQGVWVMGGIKSESAPETHRKTSLRKSVMEVDHDH